MKTPSECAEIVESIKAWWRRLVQLLHRVIQLLYPKTLGCLILVGLHRLFMWVKRAWSSVYTRLRGLPRAISNLLVRTFWRAVKGVAAFVLLSIVYIFGLWVYQTYLTEACDTKPLNDPKQGRINLKQCWTDEQRKMFYTTDEGSLVIPYDIIKYLERPNSNEPFLSENTIKKYGFLPLEEGDFEPFSSAVDADGLPPRSPKDWPLGLVLRDVEEGEWAGKWLGITCAACHTAEIHYSKDKDGKPLKDKDGKSSTIRLRVDGAPGMVDVTGFLFELYESLQQTYCDGAFHDLGKGGSKFEKYTNECTDKK